MIELDRTDRLLLEALQKNARTSYKELAALTGVAPSTCLERLRRLRARGVITGFHAEIDHRALGRNLEALIAVRFRAHDREFVKPFVEHVLSQPEVITLFNVSGEDDYLLHVSVRDTDELRTFVLDQLGARPEVEHVTTSLVYEHVRTRPVGARS